MQAETSLWLRQHARTPTHTHTRLALGQHPPVYLGTHANEAAVVEIRTRDTMIAAVDRVWCLN